MLFATRPQDPHTVARPAHVLPLLLATTMTLAGALSGCRNHNGTVDTADALLDSFSASCRTQYGTWTEAALAQTQSLKSTLEILKASQDTACSAATSALANVESLSTELSRLTLDSTSQEYIGLVQQQSDLEALIADLQDSTDANDQALLATLQSSYATNQVTLITLESTLKSNASISGNANVVTGLTNLGTYAQNLLASSESLTQCYAGAPYMAFQLAGSLAALSGSFLTRELGAAFSTIGQMMAAGVDALRRASLESKILRLEATKMQAAIGCAMESMADLYCDAESSWRLVELAAKSAKVEHWEPTGVWKAIDLVSERLPILIAWLQEVRGGVAPPNPSAADYINGYWDKLFSIQKSRTSVDGILEETRTFLNGVDDATQKDKLLSSALNSIFEAWSQWSCSNTCIPHPVYSYFSDTQGSEMVCRLVQDENHFNKDCCKYDVSGYVGYYSPTQCLSNITYDGEIENFQSRASAVLDEIEIYTYDLIAKVSNQDVARLAHSARESSLDNDSPVRVMKRLRDYLVEIAPGAASDSSKKALIEETRRALDEVIAAIENDEGLTPSEKIKTVYSKFQLKTGTQWINDRIKDLVQWDVEGRIKSGEVGKDVASDLIASGMTIYESLAAAGVSLSQLQLLKDDIDNGQSTTQQNLASLGSAFGKHIETAMRQLREAAIAAGEPEKPVAGLRRPNFARLGRLCALVETTLPKWPKGVTHKYCLGTTLESVFDQAPLSVSYEDIQAWAAQQPLRKRMCLYSNFYRASRLYTTPGADVSREDLLPAGLQGATK